MPETEFSVSVHEISATYVGYSDEKITLNHDESESGKFFSVDEVKELIKQKDVTPHLGLSLEIYLRYKGKQ